MKRILIVDDEISTCILLQKFLTRKNYTVDTTTRGRDALNLIKQHYYDVLICDYRLQDIDGSELYENIMVLSPKSVVIFITGYVNLRKAVDLVKKGAYHYLAKPLNPDELLGILEGSISDKNNVVHPPTEGETKPGVGVTQKDYVIGKSNSAKLMLNHVRKVGPTNYTVIIEGETGTGKESLARLIHEESSRKNQPFIPIDCGSLSKEIAASELFGHEKGAFTGAIGNKTGIFEIAKGGTVFLDEIANLSIDIQVALLRALQEKVIRKIGSVKEIPIDVRIIVATNEDLFQKSENSSFREDFYYRLNEFTLRVPPLRERMEDLPLFIDFFLEMTAEEINKKKPQLSDEVLEIFYKYPWPGNIRELKNVLRRACLFVTNNNEINKEALPSNIMDYEKDGFKDPVPVQNISKKPNGKTKSKGEEIVGLKATSLKAETDKIIEVLQEVRFNKTKAAEKLNINRKTLYCKLKSLNISY